MTIYQDKLRELIGEADTTVEGIVGNVVQIDDIIAEVQEQIDAITEAVTDVCQTDLVDRLTNVKLPAFQATYPGAYLDYDAGFGDLGYGNTLTGWRIMAPAPPPIPPAPPDPDITVYEYGGTGWDSDASLTQWVSDWDFGNDYITKPLTAGSTYGLSPYLSNLQSAKSILESNATKISDSKAVFTRYI